MKKKVLALFMTLAIAVCFVPTFSFANEGEAPAEPEAAPAVQEPAAPEAAPAPEVAPNEDVAPAEEDAALETQTVPEGYLTIDGETCVEKGDVKKATPSASGVTFTYDAATSTATVNLNGCNLKKDGIQGTLKKLIVVVKGINTISESLEPTVATYSNVGGISNYGDIEISGDGSVTISNFLNGIYTNDPIHKGTGNITITDTKINIGNAGNYGIQADQNLTIKGNAQITAVGKDFYGISAGKVMNIDLSKKGFVKAQGGKAAVVAFEGINITGVKISEPANGRVAQLNMSDIKVTSDIPTTFWTIVDEAGNIAKSVVLEETKASKKKKDNSDNAVGTGDSMNLALFGGMALMALIGAAAVFATRREQ